MEFCIDCDTSPARLETWVEAINLPQFADWSRGHSTQLIALFTRRLALTADQRLDSSTPNAGWRRSQPLADSDSGLGVCLDGRIRVRTFPPEFCPLIIILFELLPP